MNQKSKVLLLLALTTVNAGLIILPPKILEGPSSKTTLVGPDGSVISAFAPGGKIVLDDNHGPLLQGAPEVVAIAGVPQPLPVTETAVVEEVAPVATEGTIDVETVSVDAVTVPAVSKGPEKLVQSEDAVESTTEAKPVTAETESAGENKTETTTAKVASETPANVGPLPKGHAHVGVKTVESPVVLSFIHDSPLFAPEYSAFEGHFIPDDFEHGFDDGAYNHAFLDW